MASPAASPPLAGAFTVTPYGASDASGAMGHALAAEEIVSDLPGVVWIVHGSGSAGTQAGLLAGLLTVSHPAHVVGVGVDAQPERVRTDVCRVGREAAALPGCEAAWGNKIVEIADDWSGPAYGVPSAITEEAIRLAAQLEGLTLDPMYSGKSMAGLIGLARDGHFADGGPVVWIHTGGSLGIFAYPQIITRASGHPIGATQKLTWGPLPAEKRP